MTDKPPPAKRRGMRRSRITGQAPTAYKVRDPHRLSPPQRAVASRSYNRAKPSMPQYSIEREEHDE